MSFTPAGFLLHLWIFLFPLKIEEEADIQHDAHSDRSGRGQTGHGQAGVGLDVHDVSHRQADPKGPCTMTQTVDEGAERQKRNLRQKLLQSQRQANVQELAALEVETEISLFELERQMFFQQHRHSAHDADSLRRRGDGGHHSAADDDLPDVLGVLFAQIAGDEDGDAHCKLGHYKGHEVEHLTAGGDSGKTRGGSETTHHQQVYRTVGGLQHQRAQNGQHKEGQLFRDAALREIALVAFQEKFSFRT